MRQIELYVGYQYHYWDTFYVDIPRDTPEEHIHALALDVGQNCFAEHNDVAFIGVYNVPELEEEE